MGASVWANAGLVPKSECKQRGWVSPVDESFYTNETARISEPRDRSVRIGTERVREISAGEGGIFNRHLDHRLDFQTEILSQRSGFQVEEFLLKRRFVAGKRACSADKIEGVGRRTSLERSSR